MADRFRQIFLQNTGKCYTWVWTLLSLWYCISLTITFSFFLSLSLSLSTPSLPFCVFCLRSLFVPQSICLSVCPSVCWFQNTSSMNESLKLLMFSARGAAVVSSDVITSCVVVGVVLGAGKNENIKLFTMRGKPHTQRKQTILTHQQHFVSSVYSACLLLICQPTYPTTSNYLHLLTYSDLRILALVYGHV